MADEQQQATQQKEEAAKTAQQAELAKWGDDFPTEQLEVKYKADEEKKGDEKVSDEDTAKDDTDKDEAAKATTEEEEVYAQPAPVVTTEDPGEYTPQDYSFDIKIKGKTHKVDSAERAAELADEFAEDLSAKQLVALISKGTNIEVRQERDKEAWEKSKKTFDAQNEVEQERQQTITTMASEFEYLVGKGLIPAVAKEYADANWQDPQVAKQPGVKEHLELLSYMNKENQARAKVNVKPLTSIVDAYNAWQLDESRKQKDDETKAAGEARKAAGARVAGVSPTQQGTSAPKGIAVGNPNIFKRSASIWDD